MSGTVAKLISTGAIDRYMTTAPTPWRNRYGDYPDDIDAVSERTCVKPVDTPETWALLQRCATYEEWCNAMQPVEKRPSLYRPAVALSGSKKGAKRKHEVRILSAVLKALFRHTDDILTHIFEHLLSDRGAFERASAVCRRWLCVSQAVFDKATIERCSWKAYPTCRFGFHDYPSLCVSFFRVGHKACACQLPPALLKAKETFVSPRVVYWKHAHKTKPRHQRRPEPSKQRR